MACQQYPFLFQPASTVSGQNQEVTDTKPFESDILFVIDNSGSMKTKQDKLIASMNAFITELAGSQNKYQIGITTTDENCEYTPPSPNPWDGKCGRLFSPDGNDPVIRRTDFTDNNALIARFNTVVAGVGTSGSPYEQGMKAARDAVTTVNTGVGKPNAGFVRPEALLLIIIVSDESDCSYSDDPEFGLTVFVDTSLDVGESCYQFADKLIAPAVWGQQILDVKTRQLLVAVGIITGAVFDANGAAIASECSVGSDGHATNQCSCFEESPLSYCKFTQDTSPPPGQVAVCDDASCCTSLANARYSQFADFWSAHVKGSVCESDYSNTMFQLANIAINDCFTVDPPPADDDPNNISISRRVSGQTAFVPAPMITKTQALANGNGWYYETDPTTEGKKVHQVCLAGTFHRKLGDTFRVFVLSSTKGSTSDIAASR